MSQNNILRATKLMKERITDKDAQSHAIKVYQILSTITENEDTLIAGILHDIIEDTDTQPSEIHALFGKKVIDLIMEVTHEGHQDEYGYYFPRLKSRDGIIIKFADRLSNLTRISTWSEQRKEQYLRTSKFWRD